MNDLTTPEMRRALEADGEKLRQLTGEDHGPHFIPEPVRSAEQITFERAESLTKELQRSALGFLSAEITQRQKMSVNISRLAEECIDRFKELYDLVARVNAIQEANDTTITVLCEDIERALGRHVNGGPR